MCSFFSLSRFCRRIYATHIQFQMNSYESGSKQITRAWRRSGQEIQHVNSSILKKKWQCLEVSRVTNEAKERMKRKKLNYIAYYFLMCNEMNAFLFATFRESDLFGRAKMTVEMELKKKNKRDNRK